MGWKEWDENAIPRYNQMISGNDITYKHVFLPLWNEFILGLPLNYREKMLEVGSGPGVLTKDISPLFNEIICLEPSEQMRLIAEKHNMNSEINFDSTPIEEYLDELGQFSMCISHMVFHSIESLTKSFNAVYRVLQNNGIFAFIIPHPSFYHLYHRNQFDNFNYMLEKKFLIDFTISMDNNSLPNKIPYYHRPFSTYLNGLIECGFEVRSIKEIMPTSEVEELYPFKWDTPRYLFITAQKLRY